MHADVHIPFVWASATTMYPKCRLRTPGPRRTTKIWVSGQIWCLQLMRSLDAFAVIAFMGYTYRRFERNADHL